jgi:GNAT superfamily N-acetyltransferase
MDNVVIKLAAASDIAILAEHDKHISLDVLSRKVMNEEMYIAYEGTTFIGWLRYNLFWDNMPFMNMLYILAEYRGIGIGKRLVQFWERNMKSQGHKTLMTSTQQNETAQHFYEHLGYRAVGGFMQPNNEYEIVFMKKLGE